MPSWMGKWRHSQLVVSLLCFLIFFAGFIASQNLDRYPRRSIERPNVLPEGVKAWGGGLGVHERSDDFGKGTWREYPIPLGNSVGISDRTTLAKLFFVLMVAMQYEMARTERWFM